MLDFVNDYSEGAHEKILLRLLETNMEKLSGYGTDQYCESAKQKIREVCECPEADIYFLVGGTQTNATVIDAIIQYHQRTQKTQGNSTFLGSFLFVKI